MDLFTLVAKLTLDPGEYDREIENAERKAGSAKIDVSGTISAVDQFSEALEEAEGNAAEADLDADGTISLDDDYSDELDALESDASMAELDVEGEATLDHSEFDSSIEDMESQVNSLDGLLKGLKVAGIATGISAAASWAYGVIDDTVQYADRVDKTSQALGLTYEAFQEWDHALSQSGANIESTKRGILNMNEAMGGTASEDIMDAYSRLGINPMQYTSKEQLFSDTMMALAGMEAGQGRDDIVTAIFGRNGTELNAMFNSGQEAIQELVQEAHDLGLVMSDEDVRNNVKLGDDISNLKASVQSLLMEVVSTIAPALISIVEFVTSIVQGIQSLVSFFTGESLPLNTGENITNNVNNVTNYQVTNTSFHADNAGTGSTTYSASANAPSFDPNANFSLRGVATAAYDGLGVRHAKGLWSVPYDDYSALLHRDEMVLTASQAREYREGSGDGDAVAAIQRLGAELANLKIMVGEKVFGQTVVDYSGKKLDRYLGKTESKSYAGYGWG